MSAIFLRTFCEKSSLMMGYYNTYFVNHCFRWII